MGARERLWQFIEAEHPEDAGIVYCLSRKSVDETAAWLSGKGRTALAYHAGLEPQVRRSVLERFRKDSSVIVVATIAFGMGIDKPDVRFVAHLNLPKSIEAYYQETGRAGRDGMAANAWLAYGLQDLIQLRQWIEQSEARGLQAVSAPEARCADRPRASCRAAGARRCSPISASARRQPCGNCDNCISPPETMDGTVLAQKALSAVYRTGQRFGATYWSMCCGPDHERIDPRRHDKLPVFGIGKDTDEAHVAGASSASWRQQGILPATTKATARCCSPRRRARCCGARSAFRCAWRRTENAHRRRKRQSKSAASVIADADQPAVRGPERAPAQARGRGQAAALRHLHTT